MAPWEWKRFILEWSQRIAAQDFGENAEYTRNFDPVFGYGAAGVSDEIISATEARLSTVLPPSYKEFLRVTNGLKQPFEQMAATGGDFSPIERIDWFRVDYSDWITAWCEQDPFEVPDEDYFVYGLKQNCGNLRTEYLKTALAISHDGDAGIYLLIPEVCDNNGEWEAWHFASWMPGANRYRTFEEMLREHYKEFESDKTAGRCFGF